jgi:hypothetical protein
MSAIKLSTPSSGSISLSPENTASNLTLTVPAQSGSIVTSDTSGNVDISGSVRAFGAYTENSTNTGVHAGYVNSTPRIGFFNGTAAQNWQVDNNDGEFRWFTPGVVRMALDSSGNLKFNSGYGSAATAYGCRAWVNFNGTGTVAIRASGNVSSITDNNTGDYTVNFTNAMPDANYAASAIAQRNVTGVLNQAGFTFIPANGSTPRQTSSAFRVMTTDQGPGPQDAIVLTIAIFR